MEQQLTTITFFRFNGFRNRLFAFTQMGLKSFRRKPEGLIFSKKVGTGSGYGFSAIPNFEVYGWLNVWNSKTDWIQFRYGNPDWQKWCDQSSEQITIFLTPTRVRGSWSRQQPFVVNETLEKPELIAAITRATIKWKFLPQFWKRVPGISRKLEQMSTDLFSVGFGEVPYKELATFSIWTDTETLDNFAQYSAEHKKAIELTNAYQWFSEDLFARFAVMDIQGEWASFKDLPQLKEKYGFIL